MKSKTIAFASFSALLQAALLSCATKARDAEPRESEIFAVKGGSLGGDEFIEARFFDRDTGEPMASRYFSIWLVGDDEKVAARIYGKSDGNGRVFVKNLPAKRYFIFFYDGEESFRKDINEEEK